MTSSEAKIAWAVVAVLVATPFLAVAHIALDGWVLSWFWWWFVVPLGAQPLGAAHAAGLSLLATLATRRFQSDPKEKADYETARLLATLFLTPFLYLFVGFVVKGLM